LPIASGCGRSSAACRIMRRQPGSERPSPGRRGSRAGGPTCSPGRRDSRSR
jgi:hypothetical protein